MKSAQVNLRLELELVAALEQAAREEGLDRGTIIRKLLSRALTSRRLDRALERYQLGEISVGRAAGQPGMTHWEIIEPSNRRRGIAHPLEPGDAEARLRALGGRSARVADSPVEYDAGPGPIAPRADTLLDHPPRAGGVLMVGINPAPVSVRARHYYQGRLGRRLWKRLQRLGLLATPIPGEEDDAFVAAGHGLSDVVKRPTRSSRELGRDEIRHGVEALRAKVGAWRPRLILLAFKEAAQAAMGTSRVSPGLGSSFESVPTFLLSGPYAPRQVTKACDEELRRLLAAPRGQGAGSAQTQRISESDTRAGIIRLPRDARRFFPATRRSVEVTLRGRRLAARYDPRLGPDRERSGVLRIGREALRRLVRPGERVRVSKAEDGSVELG